MSEKDAQGHQVEASVGRPAEFGTVDRIAELRKNVIFERGSILPSPPHVTMHIEGPFELMELAMENLREHLRGWWIVHEGVNTSGPGRHEVSAVHVGETRRFNAYKTPVLNSSDSVPPLATGSTEASIRAQAMEDCAVICEDRKAGMHRDGLAVEILTKCAAAIRAAAHISAPPCSKRTLAEQKEGS